MLKFRHAAVKCFGKEDDQGLDIEDCTTQRLLQHVLLLCAPLASKHLVLSLSLCKVHGFLLVSLVLFLLSLELLLAGLVPTC